MLIVQTSGMPLPTPSDLRKMPACYALLSMAGNVLSSAALQPGLPRWPCGPGLDNQEAVADQLHLRTELVRHVAQQHHPPAHQPLGRTKTTAGSAARGRVLLHSPPPAAAAELLIHVQVKGCVYSQHQVGHHLHAALLMSQVRHLQLRPYPFLTIAKGLGGAGERALPDPAVSMLLVLT